MMTPAPTIEELDPRPAVLSGRVEVPTRFRATFSDALTTSIEIEMVDGRPLVRQVTMSSDTTDLSAKDLRPPLRGRLLPAAIQAACREQLHGPPISTQKMIPVPRDELPATGIIGPLLVYGRRHDHRDKYNETARQTTSRRPGRPRHTTNPELLQQIADTYAARGSIADILTRFPEPPMSKSTAIRRVKEARAAGLLD